MFWMKSNNRIKLPHRSVKELLADVDNVTFRSLDTLSQDMNHFSRNMKQAIAKAIDEAVVEDAFRNTLPNVFLDSFKDNFASLQEETNGMSVVSKLLVLAKAAKQLYSVGRKLKLNRCMAYQFSVSGITGGKFKVKLDLRIKL